MESSGLGEWRRQGYRRKIGCGGSVVAYQAHIYECEEVIWTDSAVFKT